MQKRPIILRSLLIVATPYLSRWLLCSLSRSLSRSALPLALALALALAVALANTLSCVPALSHGNIESIQITIQIVSRKIKTWTTRESFDCGVQKRIRLSLQVVTIYVLFYFFSSRESPAETDADAHIDTDTGTGIRLSLQLSRSICSSVSP